jgi:hypothetical protein
VADVRQHQLVPLLVLAFAVQLQGQRQFGQLGLGSTLDLADRLAPALVAAIENV